MKLSGLVVGMAIGATVLCIAVAWILGNNEIAGAIAGMVTVTVLCGVAVLFPYEKWAMPKPAIENKIIVGAFWLLIMTVLTLLLLHSIRENP